MHSKGTNAMGIRAKALSSSMTLTVAQVFIYGASLLRNMVLARILTPADFGVSAAFAMVISLLEFSSMMGISRFVIRDPEGGDPDFINTAHSVNLLSSGLSALLILVGSVPIAHLLNISAIQSSINYLAIIPLLRGFEHLDVRRFERDLRFGPSIWSESIPQALTTLLAWPLALWYKDYRTMVALLIIKSLASTICSHGFAERPYGLKCHRDYGIRMLRFGWPLVVNGLLMFAVMQGDQFLVASTYTMTDLGPYAAAASLALVPSFLFGRVFNSIALPILAKVQNDPVEFLQRYGLVIAIVCAFSSSSAIALIGASDVWMRVVYGPAYTSSGVYLHCSAPRPPFDRFELPPRLRR